MDAHFFAIRGDNTSAFLAPMLLGIETKISKFCGILVMIDAA